MIVRIAAALAIALALSGCVLGTRAPLFPDSRGEPMLGAEPVALRAFDRERDGSWTLSRPDDPPLRFVREGRHYLASLPREEKPARIVFVALGDGWYVAEVTDDDQSTLYALVKPEGGDVLLRGLTCDWLKTTAPRGAIAFSGQDCSVRPTADPLRLFRALSALPGEPDMKYVREN